MGKGNYLNFGESPFSGAMFFFQNTTFANSTNWTPKKMMLSKRKPSGFNCWVSFWCPAVRFRWQERDPFGVIFAPSGREKMFCWTKKRCSAKMCRSQKRQHGSLRKNSVLLRCVSICQLNISTWKHKELQETKKTTSSSNLGWKFCSLPLFTQENVISIDWICCRRSPRMLSYTSP